MDINFFSAWLNDLLDPKSFKDYCVNGLCVEANTRVTRVVTGVSFRDCLIDAAIEDGADCIIVHHPNGFWKNEDRVPVGRFGARMRKLFNNGINLYGYHLPLDGHMEVGNSVQIAKAMGLSNISGFLQEGEKTIGVVGEWETAATQTEFMESVANAFPYGLQNALMYGSDTIKRVAICSGSGSSAIEEAMKLDCDVLVTGEIKEHVPIDCEELGFNLVNCGHHRTEVFGVRALAEKIQEELNIPAKFVDFDNPV